jgi:hypothetical protein
LRLARPAELAAGGGVGVSGVSGGGANGVFTPGALGALLPTGAVRRRAPGREVVGAVRSTSSIRRATPQALRTRASRV